MEEVPPSQSPLIVLAEFDEPGKLAGPLVHAGFRIETVDTADAALRFCGINCVSLVISRVTFRYGISGVELTKRLRALAMPPGVILVAGIQSASLEKVPGYPPPGVPVLRKPIMIAELLKTVSGMVS